MVCFILLINCCGWRNFELCLLLGKIWFLIEDLIFCNLKIEILFKRVKGEIIRNNKRVY